MHAVHGVGGVVLFVWWSPVGVGWCIVPWWITRCHCEGPPGLLVVPLVFWWFLLPPWLPWDDEDPSRSKGAQVLLQLDTYDVVVVQVSKI